MSFYILIITALALSMDAFAVSITCGITNSATTLKKRLKLSGAFGLFQGIMPLAGFYLSSLFKQSVESYSGIIAFIILAIIGIHMIVESLKIEEKCDIIQLTTKKIFLLAIATSIDAFAAGISFALLDINIWFTVLIITVVTFIVSYMGIVFGCKLNSVFRKVAEIIGGSILILIGIKILIEHF